MTVSQEIATMKADCINEFYQNVIEDLKKDERTSIYSNFIKLVEEKMELELQLERSRWGI